MLKESYRKMARLDLIFSGMEQGKGAAEIYNDLRVYEKKQRAQQRVKKQRWLTSLREEKRGRESEERVASILSDIPGVKKIVLTINKSPLDREGKDLLVWMEDLNRVIGVQVKSSETGILMSEKGLRQRMGVTPEELRDWQRRNMIITLNGRLSVEAITEGFEQQLAEIKQALPEIRNYSLKITTRSRSCLIIR